VLVFLSSRRRHTSSKCDWSSDVCGSDLVESIMNTTAWERENGPFDFPLCSDFWPHGEVCARYGMLRTSGTGAGASERAVFVLNQIGRASCRARVAPALSAEPSEDRDWTV